MSIHIDRDKCISCGRCSDICPGNLIREEDKGMSVRAAECWGCTACLKECPTGAVRYYLGADIGGQGGYLLADKREEAIDWYIVKPDKTKHHIRTNKKESNRY